MLFKKSNLCVEKNAFFVGDINIKLFNINNKAKIVLMAEEGFLEIHWFSKKCHLKKINLVDLVEEYSPVMISSVPALYIFMIENQDMLLVHIADRVDSHYVEIEAVENDEILISAIKDVCLLLRERELSQCLNFFVQKLKKPEKKISENNKLVSVLEPA